MRLSLTLKVATFTACLVASVVGVTAYFMGFRLAASVEGELVGRDRELAKVLAGLRTGEGKLDFDTLTSFVGSSDRVNTGLVYALEIDGGGAMLQGSLNPRLFAALDPEFAVAVRQGRRRVLERLARGEIDRQGRIKEYALPAPGGGQTRLGFDIQRIDQEIRAQRRMGLVILGCGLVLGILASVLLARRVVRPVRRLAGAMEAVARGDVNQTVQVTSSDELASLANSFNQMTRALRQMTRVKDLCLHYLAPEVVQRLLREPDPLELVSEERAVTVVCLVLDGLPQGLGGREVIRLFNEYLPVIIDAVGEHQGLVERLDGERLVAVWGAPRDLVDPELQAIRAALAAREGVARERRRQLAAGGQDLHLRVGICTGRAVAGNIGSARRVAYRVLGSAVELAWHIVALAQPEEVLVSEATYDKVRQAVAAQASAPLILEHLDEAVPLYRVTGMTA